jgi:hypothetical protein
LIAIRAFHRVFSQMVDLNSRRYPGTEQRRTTHWRKLPHPITANLTLNLIETKFWRTTWLNPVNPKNVLGAIEAST